MGANVTVGAAETRGAEAAEIPSEFVDTTSMKYVVPLARLPIEHDVPVVVHVETGLPPLADR